MNETIKPRNIPWPKDRLSNLTDSVFAFAITLLVLNIMQTYIPVKAALFSDIFRHREVFITYIVTFIIISRFWISHTRLFTLIRKYDRAIFDLNVALLFFISLFPFVAVTLSNHIDARDAVIMYASCFAAIGLLEYLIGRHAYKNDLLETDEGAAPHSLRIFTLYSLTTPLVFVVSIAIAFFSPQAAEWLWVLLLFIRQGFRWYFRNNLVAEEEVERL